MQSPERNPSILLPSLLIQQQRYTPGKTSPEAKKLILETFEKTGSLAHTRNVLLDLFSRLQREVEAMEAYFGKENFVLRLLLEKFRVG